MLCPQQAPESLATSSVRRYFHETQAAIRDLDHHPILLTAAGKTVFEAQNLANGEIFGFGSGLAQTSVASLRRHGLFLLKPSAQ
jgi:hypothetical protein